MVSKDAIDAAISAHGQWKKRLQDAISTGQSEFKPDAVKRDNACQFGQWLYSLPPDATKGEDFSKVQALHAEFHRTAGAILELALAGKKGEALKQLDVSGQYGAISGKLVLALNGWKARI